jgi:large conductance mechanosensitive channel
MGEFVFLSYPISELMLTDCHRTFLNKVFKFIGIGIALYAIVRLYIYGSDDESIIKHEKKCQYCRKKISLKVWICFPSIEYTTSDCEQAKRCFMCTSWLDGREDQVVSTSI